MNKFYLQNVNTLEVNTVRKYCRINDVPYLNSSIDSDMRGLDNFIPVGSVEFVQEFAKQNRIDLGGHETYPEHENFELYGRNIRRAEFKGLEHIPVNTFIKPIITKQFNGFLYTGEKPLHNDLDFYNECLEQVKNAYNHLVYLSSPMTFLAEYRFYQTGDEILGYARYDDNDEDFNQYVTWPVVETPEQIKHRCVTIDVGFDYITGKLFIVEVNQPWAIGYYKDGTMTDEKYVRFLIEGWKQVLRENGN